MSSFPLTRSCSLLPSGSCEEGVGEDEASSLVSSVHSVRGEPNRLLPLMGSPLHAPPSPRPWSAFKSSAGSEFSAVVLSSSYADGEAALGLRSATRRRIAILPKLGILRRALVARAAPGADAPSSPPSPPASLSLSKLRFDGSAPPHSTLCCHTRSLSKSGVGTCSCGAACGLACGLASSPAGMTTTGTAGVAPKKARPASVARGSRARPTRGCCGAGSAAGCGAGSLARRARLRAWL